MMLVPKDKQRICSTPLSFYDRIQSLGSNPIYMRYDGVRNILSRTLTPDEILSLAEPVYDDTDDSLLWYSKPIVADAPISLSELSDEASKRQYVSLQKAFIERVNTACLSMSDEERHIIKGILSTIRDEYTLCYDGRVTFVAWGMQPTKDLYNPDGMIRVHLPQMCTLSFDFGDYGRSKSSSSNIREKLRGTILTPEDMPEVLSSDGYIFTGWTPSPIDFEVKEDVTFVAQYAQLPPSPPQPLDEELCTISFATDGYASLSDTTSHSLPLGTPIQEHLFPTVYPESGYVFTGWSPEIGGVVTRDCTYYAITEPEPTCQCSFDLGNHGDSSMPTTITVPYGYQLSDSDIPKVDGHKGYSFVGWNASPTEHAIYEDTTFTAQYKHRPWYLRWWDALVGKGGWGCLRWLLLLLAIALGLFLIGLFLRECDGIRGTNSMEQIDVIKTDDGREIDDNGATTPGGDAPDIIRGDGSLPEGGMIPPVVGEGGSLPPVVKEPGLPSVIGNRLNIYFEKEDADIQACAQDFKKLYPGGEYKVIGADHETKWLLIQIPESERQSIRERLPSQLEKHHIFVVDESLFEGRSRGRTTYTSNPGWHLKAVQAQEAWKITKGNVAVRVAVIDDGLEINHPMFKDQKQMIGYNVFTQNHKLAKGEGHGTHVAGIAIGNQEEIAKGIAGIAPECSLMAVQVADNGYIPFSALFNGIMYALNHEADIINVSLGGSYEALQALPEEQQRIVARTRLKNEEKAWNKLYDIARNRNAIIVFAAGNDHVLASISPMLRSRFSVNVAATDQNNRLAPFSNYGEGSNISAPGVGIYSAVPNGGYEGLDGTSMAAPIVTGTLALMRSLRPELDVEEAIAILQTTGIETDRHESPMVQIAAALEMVQSGRKPEPRRDLPSASNISEELQHSPNGDEIDAIHRQKGAENREVSKPQNDREQILRLIEMYKRQIEELERQLNNT